MVYWVNYSKWRYYAKKYKKRHSLVHGTNESEKDCLISR